MDISLDFRQGFIHTVAVCFSLAGLSGVAVDTSVAVADSDDDGLTDAIYPTCTREVPK